jgi:hypothetical protein
MEWTEDRLKELDKLDDLLIGISNINNGSDFIGRMEECIQIATSLKRSNINTGRKSFFQFLISQVHKD